MQSSQRLAGSQSQTQCCTSIIIGTLCSKISKLCKKPDPLDAGLTMSLAAEKKGCTDNIWCKRTAAAGLALACVPITLFALVADGIQCVCSPFSKCCCKKQDTSAQHDSYNNLSAGPSIV